MGLFCDSRAALHYFKSIFHAALAWGASRRFKRVEMM
jgi:hypothetical protein